MTMMKSSNTEWLGDIPIEWDIAQIGNYYELRNKKVSDYDFMPLSVTMNGIVPQLVTAAKSDDHSNRKLVKKGDFVINSRSDRRGSCGISPLDGSVSLINIVMEPRGEMNPQYYNWLFHTEQFADEFYKWGHGIVDDLWTTHWQEMKKILIVAPSLDEQQAIADYLDETCSKIDEIIAEAKISIDAYKELRIAAVNDAVTHGIHNNAVKDSNVDWIGKIPDNWKIIITKRLFKIKKEIAGKEGYTVLSITQKGIVPKVFGGKGQFAADYSNYQIVNKGDFAMNHMDLLTGWLDISDYDGVTSPDYRVFVPTGYKDIYAPYYKYVMQNCYSCRIYYGLGHGVAGMGRWRLPADMFLNFKLPMPPKAEQKEIADFLDKRTVEIDSLITEKQALINDLEAYKKSLIYEVVTGKRRVV